jgi:hypothetical protein
MHIKLGLSLLLSLSLVAAAPPAGKRNAPLQLLLFAFITSLPDSVLQQP